MEGQATLRMGVVLHSMIEQSLREICLRQYHSVEVDMKKTQYGYAVHAG